MANIGTTGSTSSSSSNAVANNAKSAVSGGNPNAILVSEKQRGNPLLASIRLCSWEFSKTILADYVMGTTCALFLSMNYHILHPGYIEHRMRELAGLYKLRVLLVLVDEDNVSVVLSLNKICFSNDFTFIAAASNQECARYLETFKHFENKSSAAIQEKVETEFLPKLTRALTSVRSINKNDVQTLMDGFDTFGGICQSQQEQLVLCPGIGEKKAKRLFRALHEPFSENAQNKKKSKATTLAFPNIADLSEARARASATATPPIAALTSIIESAENKLDKTKS